MGNLKQKIRKVNEILLKGEPKNISVDSTNGYLGYEIQCVLDAMNDVFGVDGWAFKASEGKIYETVAKPVRRLLVLKVSVTFYVKMTNNQWAGVEATGQAEIEHGNIGNAEKSATADGLKKALSYASIGNRAYHGKLEAPEITTEIPVAIVRDMVCERCKNEGLTKVEAEFSQQIFGRILGRNCQLKVKRQNGKLNNKKKRSR